MFCAPSVSVCVCVSVRVSTICLLPAILRRRWPVRRQNGHTHSLEANAEPLLDSFHIGLLLCHHEAMFCHRPCGICLLPAILRQMLQIMNKPCNLRDILHAHSH